MKTVDEVLRNYFSYVPDPAPKREKFIEAYYANIERKDDPCWRKISSKDYGIEDHCDIFWSVGKLGSVLALYSAEKQLADPKHTQHAAYPCHLFIDSPYSYYGLKLNILAYLCSSSISRLWLFYGDNLFREFQKKEIYASMVLDHYVQHYKEIQVPNQFSKSLDSPSQSLIQFN